MTGIDTILSDLSAKISAGLPYVTKSYGRAQIFREIYGDKGLVTLPKAHMGNGEYEYCLPQDTSQAQSYFIAAGKEFYKDFDRVNIGQIHRQFAFTFWGNLTLIAKTLEDVKFDAIKVIQKSQYVASIDSYADDQYKDVFPEFAYWIGRNATRGIEKKEADTQWLMYPNAGFRLVFTVNYIQPC